jgi:hypothetical protein
MMASRRKKRQPVPSQDGVGSDGRLLGPSGRRFTWEALTRQEEWFTVLLLLAFGIYQSVLYYQHLAVPNVDFMSFVGTSQPLFDLKLPASFKRLPILGLLQIGVSKLCFGPHPLLTAGWILNGILHALTVVLFYRVGKHLIGQAAFYFALLAAVNPWILLMVPDPIVETTLIFFMLLTLDCLFRRSGWCYFFAMVTSMTRHEGAGLIAIAFLVNIILQKGKKEKFKAVLFSFLASVPFLLWMAGWLLLRPAEEGYSGLLTAKEHVGLEYWKLLSYTTLGSFAQLPSHTAALYGTLKVTTQEQAQAILQSAEKMKLLLWTVPAISLLGALLYSICKKQWKFWALFGFWAMYVMAHAYNYRTRERYTIPAIWMTLLIVMYGFQKMGEFIREKRGIPRPVITGIQILLSLLTIWGIIQFVPILPATVSVSKTSASLVYVSICVLAVYLVFQWWSRPPKDILKTVTCFLLCCFLILVNQFQVARVVGNGDLNIEFKRLAEWYLKHAEPGDKMLTSMTSVVRIFAPEHENNIDPVAGPEKTFEEFIQTCTKKGVKYVVWDSRQGLSPNDYYYISGNLQKIAPLGQPRDIGPFQYIDKIWVNPRRYLYIFRFRPPSESPLPAN